MDLVIGVSTITAFALILLLIYLFFKRQVSRKDSQINELLKSLSDQQAKLKDEEKRQAFRMKLLEQKCALEFVDFGDESLEKLKHRKVEGQIKDISRTGIKLICEFDLPVRKQITLQLNFVLQDEDFSFKGKIVRKEEKLNDITYGIEFIEVGEKEQQQLFKVLQTMEIERKGKIV